MAVQRCRRRFLAGSWRRDDAFGHAIDSSRQDTALDHLREATLTPTSTPNQKEKAARERLTDVRRRAKAMNFRPVRIILLCTTTVLCPAVLFGQAEPGSLPENSAQPAQSSQPMPGPGRQQ